MEIDSLTSRVRTRKRHFARRNMSSLYVVSTENHVFLINDKDKKQCFSFFLGFHQQKRSAGTLEFRYWQYTGEIQNGKPHGVGMAMYHRRGSYFGAWKEGKRHGDGCFTGIKGAEYTGQFKNDKRHGTGTFKYSDGSTYSGQWREGKYHGKGTFIWPDGSTFKGQYENGLRQGRGTLVMPNGCSYTGGWVKDKKHGDGTMTLLRGAKYSGQWKNNDKDGIGMFTYYDGTKYVGSWKDNMQHGYGTLYLPHEGTVYAKWVNDNGSGILRTFNDIEFTVKVNVKVIRLKELAPPFWCSKKVAREVGNISSYAKKPFLEKGITGDQMLKLKKNDLLNMGLSLPVCTQIESRIVKLKSDYARYVTNLQANCQPQGEVAWWSLGCPLFPWRFADTFLKYGSWKSHGKNPASYKTCHIIRKGDILEPFEYERLHRLMAYLDGSNFKIVSAKAIKNDRLQKAFEVGKQKLATGHRVFPNLFNNAKWKKDSNGIENEEKKRRESSLQVYNTLVNNVGWNKDTGEYDLPIIPAIYACKSTSSLRHSISRGFNTDLSKDSQTDRVRLSSSVNYIKKYAKQNEDGTLTMLVCYIAPGNIYPILENENVNSVVDGYQSHFVHYPKQSPHASEIIMFNREHILPTYVVTLQPMATSNRVHAPKIVRTTRPRIDGAMDGAVRGL